MAELMLEGSKLMLLGMGSVFIFLIVLVFAMKGMSALAAILDAGEPQSVAAGTPQAKGQATMVDTVMPVIAAAIAAHRNKQK